MAMGRSQDVDHRRLWSRLSPPPPRSIFIKLRLPPHRPDLYKGWEVKASFFQRKTALLQKINPIFTIEAPLEFQICKSLSKEDAGTLLDQIIKAARILFLDEVQLYFMEEDDDGPYDFVNELESLNAIFVGLTSSISSTETDGKEVLQHLVMLVTEKIKDLRPRVPVDPRACHVPPLDPAGSLARLEHWLLSNNMKTKLKIANVPEGGGRGLVAREDINIGDVVLEIPLSLVISEDIIESDMQEKLGSAKHVKAASHFGFAKPITSKERLVLWTMKEKGDGMSKFKCYFDTLPNEFKTGLSFGKDACTVAEQTRLSFKIYRAKKRVTRRYKELCKMYGSDLLPEAQFTKESFRQACELLDSNAIEALLPNGTRKICLVPFAGFFNHSLHPHILHCDWGTDSLKFVASQSCGEGQQCYLNYGNFSGCHLITYYGFLPEGDNYNDIIEIEEDIFYRRYESCYPKDETWRRHMLRCYKVGKRDGESCLPKTLKDHIYAFVGATSGDATIPSALKREVIECLKHLLDECIYSADFKDREMRKSMGKNWKDPNWDVDLAQKYRKLEKRIYMSGISACVTDLETFPGYNGRRE